MIADLLSVVGVALLLLALIEVQARRARAARVRANQQPKERP